LEPINLHSLASISDSSKYQPHLTEYKQTNQATVPILQARLICYNSERVNSLVKIFY